jgi:4-aminobutyrate aminotransferase-like enzyme
MGTYLKEQLHGLAEKHPLVGDVRGKGLLVALELVTDRTTKEPARAAATRLLQGAKDRGLIVGRGGLYGNVIRICPPLIITRANVDEAVRILDATLTAI